MYQKKIQETNENNVFRYVFYKKENFVINDISESLNISFPTSKKIINNFLKKNIVTEKEKVGKGVGRKAMEYSFNDFFCYSIGVKLSKNETVIILINSKGLILKEKKEFYSKNFYSKSEEIQVKILNLIKDFVNDLSKSITKKLIGIGISVPGIVSTENKFIEFNSTTKINLSFISQLKKELHFPIFVENESNLASIAEGFLTSHSSCSLFTVLTINDYVGISNFHQEKFKKNFYFKAGRLHHMIIEFNGKLCECGSKGCWGTYISNISLIDDFKKIFPEIKNLNEIFSPKYFQNEKSKDIFNSYIKHLAIGIKNILFFSNPEKLIISGEICFYKDYIKEKLLEEIYTNHIFYRDKKTITFSKFNDKSIVIGAAMFPIVDQLF